MATFIKVQNQKLNLTNPKWIIFGGSYSGSLALWFRQLYPDLAVGAVGSSGPIEPKVDFYGSFLFCSLKQIEEMQILEYLQVVENSFRDFDASCADNIKSAFHELDEYMEYKNGRIVLDSFFK